MLPFFPEFFINFPGSAILSSVDSASQTLHTIIFRVYMNLLRKGLPYINTLVTFFTLKTWKISKRKISLKTVKLYSF